MGVVCGIVVAFVVGSAVRSAADFEAWSVTDNVVRLGLGIVFSVFFIRVFTRWFEKRDAR
jgi:hypothetical protein